MKKISAICLVAAALLLLSFFIILFLAIRPDPDDMIISLDIRERSLYYALKMRYLLSSFRTTLIVSDAFVLGSNDAATYPGRIFLYYFCTFLILIFTLYGLLRRLLSLHLREPKDKFFLVGAAIMLSGAIYFLCSNRIEVFGWLGASEGHLVPMVFVLLALLFLLRNTFSVLDLALLTISVVVIAGGAEHVNIIVLCMNAGLFYFIYKLQSGMVNKKKLLYFSILHLICFTAFVTNPGVWHRVNDVNIAQAGIYDPGNFFPMFFQPYKLVGMILSFCSAWAVKNYFDGSWPGVSLKHLLFIGIVIFVICFAMGLGAYHTYALGRIWFPFDIFLCGCFFLAGLKVNFSPMLSTSVSVIAVLLIGVHAYRHIPALLNFRKEYDQIVDKVIDAKPRELVMIENFPEPDLVNLVALNESPGDQLNELFCRFYGSKAKISVRSDHSKSR